MNTGKSQFEDFVASVWVSGGVGSPSLGMRSRRAQFGHTVPSPS